MSQQPPFRRALMMLPACSTLCIILCTSELELKEKRRLKPPCKYTVSSRTLCFGHVCPENHICSETHGIVFLLDANQYG